MYLPECQQSPVKAHSKEAPDRRRLVHVAAASFFLGSRWTHAGSRRFGLVTILVANAVPVAQEPTDRTLDFFTNDTAWRAFFSVVGQWLQR